MDIKIDESKLTEAPGIFKRVLNAILAVVYAILLTQIILFTLTRISVFPHSVIILFDNYYFLGALGIAAIFGWIYGNGFHGWLRNKMEDWNLWGF